MSLALNLARKALKLFFLKKESETSLPASFCAWFLKKNIYLLTQPAWDVSERSQSDLYLERHLRDLLETSQKRWLFCDVFKTSQIHLKKDVFFVTSLRRLKYISRKMSFLWRPWDVSKTSLASIFGFSKITHKNDFVWFP